MLGVVVSSQQGSFHSSTVAKHSSVKMHVCTAQNSNHHFKIGGVSNIVRKLERVCNVEVRVSFLSKVYWSEMERGRTHCGVVGLDRTEVHELVCVVVEHS